jgi:hypothetical protein
MKNVNLFVKSMTVVAVILAVCATLLFFIVDVTALFVTTYIFAMLGLAGVWLSGYWALKKPNTYPWSMAVPMTAVAYLVAVLSTSSPFVVREQMGLLFAFPFGWLALTDGALLVVAVVRVIFLSAGTKAIERVDEEVKASTSNWKMLAVQAQAVLAKTPDSLKSDVRKVVETIRYSDPVENPSLSQYDEVIRENVAKLDRAVSEADAAMVSDLCVQLERQIKERNNVARLMK